MPGRVVPPLPIARFRELAAGDGRLASLIDYWRRMEFTHSGPLSLDHPVHRHLYWQAEVEAIEDLYDRWKGGDPCSGSCGSC